MAFGKKCERYFEKRNQRVMRLLDKVPAGYEQEDYHRLRLEVKKIRAFLKMAAHIAGLSEKKFFKPYRHLFKEAGYVRDVQMTEALLANQRPMKWLQQYRRELRAEAKLWEEGFYLGIDKGIRSRLKKMPAKVRSYLKKVKKRSVSNYLLEEERRIRKIISAKKIRIEDAHELRIKLKRLGYVMRLMSSKTKEGSGEIERVQEQLGIWHDHRQLAERLRHDAAEEQDKQRKIHMLNLEKTISHKAKRMLAEIGHSLRTIGQTAMKKPRQRRGFSLLIRSRASSMSPGFKPAKT